MNQEKEVPDPTETLTFWNFDKNFSLPKSNAYDYISQLWLQIQPVSLFNRNIFS